MIHSIALNDTRVLVRRHKQINRFSIFSFNHHCQNPNNSNSWSSLLLLPMHFAGTEIRDFLLVSVAIINVIERWTETGCCCHFSSIPPCSSIRFLNFCAVFTVPMRWKWKVQYEKESKIKKSVTHTKKQPSCSHEPNRVDCFSRFEWITLRVNNHLNWVQSV